MKTYREDGATMAVGGYLSDKVYRAMILSMPIPCVDVVIVSRSSDPPSVLWLAHRMAKPWPRWWIIGGRMFAGETHAFAVQRAFKRETGLDLAVERFQFLSVSAFIWKDRQQEPQTAGSHNISLAFVVDLTPSELTAVQLDAKEYHVEQGLKPFNRKDLTREHPVLLAHFDQIFA